MTKAMQDELKLIFFKVNKQSLFIIFVVVTNNFVRQFCHMSLNYFVEFY